MEMLLIGSDPSTKQFKSRANASQTVIPLFKVEPFKTVLFKKTPPFCSSPIAGQSCQLAWLPGCLGHLQATIGPFK